MLIHLCDPGQSTQMALLTGTVSSSQSVLCRAHDTRVAAIPVRLRRFSLVDGAGPVAAMSLSQVGSKRADFPRNRKAAACPQSMLQPIRDLFISPVIWVRFIASTIPESIGGPRHGRSPYRFRGRCKRKH